MKNEPNSQKILLVEDDVVVSLAQIRILSSAGYKVVTAHTGEDAVSICSSDSEILLVLMDINLGPGIDGTEAARIILHTRTLPLIFLSSHTEPDVVAKTETISSYGFVVKSAGATVLLASIRMALRLFDARTELLEKEATLHASSEELKESDERFRKMFEIASVGMVQVSADTFTFMSVNDAYAKLTGYTREELTSATFGDITFHEDRATDTLLYLQARDDPNGVYRNEKRYVRKDGKCIWVRVNAGFIRDETGKGLYSIGIIEDISEKREAEQELFVAARRYQNLLDGLLEGCHILDHDLRYVFINDTALAQTGKTKSEVLGAQVESIIDPGKNDAFFKTLKLCVEDGKNRKIDHPFVVKGRQKLWCELSFQVLDEGILILSNNISDRVESRAVLEQQIEGFQELSRVLGFHETIFQKSPQAIMVAYPDGRIGMANDAFLNMLGYSEEELKNETWAHGITPPEWHDREHELLTHLDSRNDSVRYQKEYKHKDGRLVPVELVVKLVSSKRGRHLYYTCFIDDLSEIKKAESALEELNKEKDILLREMRHRMKNSFFTIESLIQAEETMQDEAPMVSMLNSLRSRIHVISQAYTRLDLRAGSRLRLDMYLGELIASLQQFYGTNVPSLNIQFACEPCELDAQNVSNIGLILNELIMNSHKHAFAGRKFGSIKVLLKTEQGSVVLELSDDGSGFPPNFNPDQSTRLGYLLIAQLCDSMKAKLEYRNSGGAVVTIRVPDRPR